MRRYEACRRREPACPVLNGPKPYPSELFTDTIHHLSREEEWKRTDTFIALVSAAPMLTHPPYSFFTDTIHHLGASGRRVRTERVIALLEAIPGMRRAGHGE